MSSVSSPPIGLRNPDFDDGLVVWELGAGSVGAVESAFQSAHWIYNAVDALSMSRLGPLSGGPEVERAVARGHRPHPRAVQHLLPRQRPSQRPSARPTPALKRIGAPGVTEVSTSSAHISMREAKARSRSPGLAGDRRKGFPIFRVGNQIADSERPIRSWLCIDRATQNSRSGTLVTVG